MQIRRRWDQKIPRALGCVGSDSYWRVKEGRRGDECLSEERDVGAFGEDEGGRSSEG